MASTQTPPQDQQTRHPYRSDRPVVFFDGECVMCNGFANRLLQIDASGRVWIATLQGQTAQRYLPPLPPVQEEWSFYYLDRHGFYDQSDAFVQLCAYLGGGWAVLGMIRVIPTPIRNTIYRFIARNRYRWFGRRLTCRRPTTEEQHRFLP